MIRIQIICDNCDAKNTFKFYDVDALEAIEVTDEAVEGWGIAPERTYCPKCWPKFQPKGVAMA